MTGWRAAIALLGTLCWLPLAMAQEFVRIGNRLTPDQFLHIERGPIQSGRIEPHWWSAQWRLEPVPGTTEFVRIRNRWKAGEFLRVRHGEVDWAVLSVPGGPYVRLRSRARDGEYLHLERGVLQTGAVPRDAPSSHWLLAEAPAGKAGASQDVRSSRMRNRAEGTHDWSLEQVGDLEFFRVRDTGTPNSYYHIERGRLENGTIEPGWWSAQWKVERIAGAQFFRLRNRWRNDQFLHVVNGRPANGPVPPGTPGADWLLVTVPAVPPPASDRWHGPK